MQKQLEGRIAIVEKERDYFQEKFNEVEEENKRILNNIRNA